jgi:hypothetical protein
MFVEIREMMEQARARSSYERLDGGERGAPSADV